MSELARANVRECLEIVKDFHHSVAVDEGMKEKKEQAGYALDHLAQIFHGEVKNVRFGRDCEDKIKGK